MKLHPLDGVPLDGAITVTLPFPPSYNAYWRSGRKGNYISSSGKKFKADARAELEPLQAEPLTGTVLVVLDFYRPRKTGDLDNRIKQVLDALQGWAYANDSQIIEIRARRFDDKNNPRVEVLVLAWEEQSP